MTNLAPSPARQQVAAPTKKQVQLTEKISLKHHTDEVWDVCFSHNGMRLASSGADMTTIIYSVDTFEVLHSLEGHSAGIGSVSWSPDDSKIVTCSQDFTATLWDTTTGKSLQTLTGFNGPVTSCVWLPSSQEFVTTALSCLESCMSLCLWSASSTHPVCKFPVRAPLLGCVLLPDKKIASFDNKRNVYVHDLDLKQQVELRKVDMDLSSMCVSELGKPHALMLRNDGWIEMIDVRSMDMMTNMVKVFKMKNYGTFVIKATFGGEDEEFVASGSEGKFLPHGNLVRD
ncbi:putative WD repeat-containing [Hyphodiscus hymeniophilus]|uniref:WD repeat-containing n=1 Tax=Hyphodiscus hymeniophilus TaxID=353542 RepID=A0A9P6VPW8_9HELO|nr:putative WD repeat-containing [Hyphodiscus hymeniophilus]